MSSDGVRETTLRLDAHTGTHIDAPSHFLPDGTTIDQLNLKTVIGGAKVVDCTEVAEKITDEFLADHNIQEGDIILLKTINSQTNATDAFSAQFVYLDATGAQFLARKKIKAVGIDYLGIERDQKGHPTHKELMKHSITIIEGLRLGGVQPGVYDFICLPLALIGLEAAPARAILIEK